MSNEDKTAAYMRFVPGLGLLSGISVGDDDDSDGDVTHHRRRPIPRSKSFCLADLGDALPPTSTTTTTTKKPSPSKVKQDQVFLPHYSLDTKFSLPPDTTTTPSRESSVGVRGSVILGPRHVHRPRTKTATTTAIPHDDRLSSDSDSESDDLDRDVHLDLGLGSDLNATIEQAVKAAKADKSRVAGANVAATAGASGGQGSSTTRQEGGGAKLKPLTLPREVPLPPEAAEKLNQARLKQQQQQHEHQQQDATGRYSPIHTSPRRHRHHLDESSKDPATQGTLIKRESKNGRKASMGLGLFKEAGSTGRGEQDGTDQPIGREGRERERLRAEAAAAAAAAARTASQDPTNETAVDEQDANDDSSSVATPTVSTIPLSPSPNGRKRVHRRALTVPAEPIDIVHDKMSRQLHRVKTDASRRSGTKSADPTVQLPSHQGPSEDDVQSGSTSMTVDPVAPSEYTSEDTWGSSCSSSVSEDSLDREPRPTAQPQPTTPASTAPRLRQTPSHIRSTHLSTAQLEHQPLKNHDHQRHHGSGMLDSPTAQARRNDLEDEDDDDLETSEGESEDHHVRNEDDQEDVMTVPLQPFRNKVGGHSEIYKFTRRAVCKVCFLVC